MTKEDRIKLIRHLKYSRSIGADYTITDKDADEIIKALEQEPSEDCVSRQAVVQWLETATDDSIEHAIDSNLAFIPPVTPIQRWIPVSDKLPESDGYYLVTEKSGRVCTYVFHKENNSEEYWKRCTVAWMPLPEPYKAESELTDEG